MITTNEDYTLAKMREERKIRADCIRVSAAKMLRYRLEDPAKLAALLAQNCVKRGARWLNRNAPNRGWWRNCLNRGRSRIHTGYSGEGVLEIVFEYDPRFADYGYSFEPKILKHFGLRWSTSAARLGFSVEPINGRQPFPRRYPGVLITSKDIDRAWEDLLLHPTGEMLTKHRHPTPLDLRFSRMSFTTRPNRWRHVCRIITRPFK